MVDMESENHPIGQEAGNAVVTCQQDINAAAATSEPMNHEMFMREAIKEAEAGMRHGRGGPFGCVIVRRGEVIARGNNRVTSTNDPTAHAEITAIREACKKLRTFSLSDCELYTSCEPCPMCLAAAYWARIPAMYYANTRVDAAAIGFDDDFIYEQIPLPPEKRALTMRPLLRDVALEVFREWQAKPDKLKY
jgi:guanine deaminase